MRKLFSTPSKLFYLAAALAVLVLLSLNPDPLGLSQGDPLLSLFGVGMTARAFLGAGDLFVNRYDPATGQYLGFVLVGNATKFEIKPNGELKDAISKGRNDYGQIIETVALQKPAELNITLNEINVENMAIALMGDVVALNQGSATLTAESLTAKLGKWIEASHQNLATAGLSLTNSAGSTTYVLGTDYEVNYRLGMIHILPTDTIADGATVKLTATANAYTGSTIKGATQPQVRCKVRLDGQNFADGQPVIVNVWEGLLTPNKAIDFLSDNFAETELTGRLKTPVGKTDPFEVEYRTA